MAGRNTSTPTACRRMLYAEFEEHTIREMMEAARGPSSGQRRIVIREKRQASPGSKLQTHCYYNPVSLAAKPNCSLKLKASSLPPATDWTWRGFERFKSHEGNSVQNPLYTAAQASEWTDVQFLGCSAYQATSVDEFHVSKRSDHLRVLPQERFRQDSNAYNTYLENQRRPLSQSSQLAIMNTPKRSSSAAEMRGEGPTPNKVLRFSQPLETTRPVSTSPKARRGASNSPRFSGRSSSRDDGARPSTSADAGSTSKKETDEYDVDLNDLMSPDWEEPWDVPERPPSSVPSQTTTADDDDDDDAMDHGVGVRLG